MVFRKSPSELFFATVCPIDLQLWSDRAYLGNVMGNLEAWLLLRSLRTLHLRVPRQSATATALAKWLGAAAGADTTVDGIPAGMISKVWHSSLQGKDKRGFDPAKQMEGGWNATFSILVSGIVLNQIVD